MATRTPEETHRALTFSSKEPETLEWIDSFAEDRPVFCDIGANVGIYSLYCYARHAKAEVYAFEPEAQSYASLCRNIAMNRFGGINAYQIALSDGAGLGTMFVSALSAGAGAAALNGHYQFMAGSGAPFRQGVRFDALDALIATHGLPQPNYLKIDVDGHEAKILAGAQKALASPELRGLLIELQYHDEQDIEETLKLLAGHGLKLVKRSDWVSEAAGWKSRNFIFEH